MKLRKLSLKRSLISLAIFVLLVINTVAYSQNQQSGSVKLVYNYPAGKTIKYMSTSKIVQDMDINGQNMQNIISSLSGCSIKSNGPSDGNIRLNILIDTLAQQIVSPMGPSGGEVEGVKGKSFNMIISPSGKEIDFKEAANITYIVVGGGPSDATQAFSDFFPNMPEGSVKPGYTWTSTDTSTNKTSTMTLAQEINSENKFEGFETINGVECARITVVISGKQNLKTQSQGMNINMYGPVTGTALVYFAPSEGYFIKYSVATKMTGTIAITSPESMTFPIVMNVTGTCEIVK